MFVVNDIIFRAENADTYRARYPGPKAEKIKYSLVIPVKEQLFFQAHNCKFRQLDQSWSEIEFSDSKLFI